MIKLPFTFRVLVLALLLGFFYPLPGQAASDLRTLKSGVWVGAVRGDDQGNPDSCYLAARKSNNEFWIILKLDDAGLHVLLYNENWKLGKGKTFRSRVVIDKYLFGKVKATTPTATGFDFLIGNDEPSMESIRSGRRISFATPKGKKTFKLKGTRRAVNVLIDCADKYLTADADPGSHSYQAGVDAFNKKDYQAAFGHFSSMADAGDAASQNALGILYYNGLGVDKDLATAAQWFQRAADQDLARAQNNLGEMYRDGEGIAQDEARALKLFRAAAINGSEQATKNATAMLVEGRTGEATALNDNVSGQASETNTSRGFVGIGKNRLSLGAGLPVRSGRIILHPGEKIDVSFRAEDGLHERSWIGFVADDAIADPTPFHTSSKDMKERTSGVMALETPRMLGDYQLWMYDAWNRKRLVVLSVHIEIDRAGASLSLPSGTTLQPGKKFSVAFKELPDGSSYNWIAIVPAGSAKDVPMDDVEGMDQRTYLKNRPQGNLTFTAPQKPGKYILRMQDQEFATTLSDIELVVGPSSAQAMGGIDGDGRGNDSGNATLGTTATATDPTVAQVWGPQMDSRHPFGTSKSAAVQRITDEMTAQLRNAPPSPVSGGPVLDPALAQFNHLYVRFGGEHWFVKKSTQYSLPDEKLATDNGPIDSKTRDTESYTGYFDFSTKLAASYFSVVPGRDGAGVNTGDDRGFGCSLQTGGLTWDGTIFSYSLSKTKKKENFVSFDDNEYARKVYCGINIVGVVAADGSALNSLQVSFRSSVSYLPGNIEDARGVSGAQNTGISYTLQNLPIDIEETYGSESPEDQNVNYLKYQTCMEFFGAGESASSYVAYLGAYEPGWTKDAAAPFVLSGEFYRIYDHTRWSGDIKRVAGRDKGDSVPPGIRVQLCKN
jgi:Sel1 repeat-containing protein